MKRSISSTNLPSLGLKHPTVARAQEVDSDPPFIQLQTNLNRKHINSTPRNVLHWFRTKDLRVEDNRGFCKAMKLAAGNKVYALFVLNPTELEFHGVGNARKKFMSNNISLLKTRLKELGVQLSILRADSPAETARVVGDFATKLDVSHVVANYEYEHDELVRDLTVCSQLRSQNIDFVLWHDQCVVDPGTVLTAKGEPRKVFTSFWHGWIPMLAKKPELLELEPVPNKQDPAPTVDGVSEVDIDKELGIDHSDTQLDHILELWPAGYDAAVNRLQEFLKSKIGKYGKDRSIPALDCTSRMSAYFAMGVISVREALKLTRELANGGKNFGTTSGGVDSWVREIAFREFYRQMVACCMPHIVMNMPSSLRFADIHFEDNDEAWKRWCDGTTGVPFVDAGMRQLNTEGFMHNRVRMNTSSYLRMNLLLDYRLGMRYFANKLVDWDCCNNTFGWDPSYTMFNGVLQAEKNDPKGEYIRKWVPELKNVPGKAVYDPHSRLSSAEFKKLNYPATIIGHQEAKDRAMARYRQATKVKKEEE